MAIKHKKRTLSPRLARSARRRGGARKSRAPARRKRGSEREVLALNERRVGSEETAQASVSEPVEEGAPIVEEEEDLIGQKEREADVDSEVEPEEDWGNPSANPPTA